MRFREIEQLKLRVRELEEQLMKFRELEQLRLRVKELEGQLQTRDYQRVAQDQVERSLNVVVFDEDHHTNLEFRD